MLTYEKGTPYIAATGTTHNVDLPDSINAGDRLLLFISFDSNPTVTLPAGWTIHVNSQPSNRGIFASKVADGSETGTITVTTSANVPTTGIIYRVRGTLGGLLMQFTNANFSGSGPATGALGPYNWLPVDTIFFSALTGFNDGTVNVNTYPNNYTTDTSFSKTGTGTTHTAYAVAVRQGTLNASTPGSYGLSGSFGGVGISVAVYEFQVQSITPNTQEIDLFGSARIKVVGDISSGATAYLDADAITLVNIDDAQTILVQIPAQANYEVVDVRVVATVGGFDHTLADAFTYTYKPPIIESVTPAGGKVGVGGSITITGQNFRSGLTVEIDGVACTSIVVVDSETITCNYPIGTTQESVILVVENDDTQSDFTNFTYMDEVAPPAPEGVITASFSVQAVQFLK